MNNKTFADFQKKISYIYNNFIQSISCKSSSSSSSSSSRETTLKELEQMKEPAFEIIPLKIPEEDEELDEENYTIEHYEIEEEETDEEEEEEETEETEEEVKAVIVEKPISLEDRI
jgi:hypothetical protein